MANKLTPVVGYPGGKRRMLVHLRPYFDPLTIRIYVEPFVGMGAVYLDLRARGYFGPAILSDSNALVCEFWRAVHHMHDGRELVQRADEFPDVKAAILKAEEAMSAVYQLIGSKFHDEQTHNKSEG